MKKLLTIALISMAGFAQANILEEHEGRYLGHGKYISTSGASDSYSSLTELRPDMWALAYLRGDSLLRYYAFFEASDDNFFDTSIIKFSGEDGEILGGYGYCVENYCHVSIDMNGNAFEETITMLENDRIKKVGSLRYSDENGASQTMRWEEKLVKMDHDLDGSLLEDLIGGERPVAPAPPVPDEPAEDSPVDESK